MSFFSCSLMGFLLSKPQTIRPKCHIGHVELFREKDCCTGKKNSPPDPGSPCQMIGVYNHLLREVFRFQYHSQKVIGSVLMDPIGFSIK